MKKTLKKIALTTSAVAICLGVANASNLRAYDDTDAAYDNPYELKVNVLSHFQAAYRNQEDLTETEKKLTPEHDKVAFNNESGVALELARSTEKVKYGAKTVLVPTSQRKGGVKFNGSHLYVETKFGRVELGSPISAHTQFFVDAGDIIAGTGFNYTRYADFTTDHLRQQSLMSPTFLKMADFALDSQLVASVDGIKYSSEPSRAVSFYTPKFETETGTSLQLGVTFIPDSSNTGAQKPNTRDSGTTVINLSNEESYTQTVAVKNAFTGGVVLEHNFSDGYDLKVSAVGQYGKAVGSSVHTKLNTAPDVDEAIEDLKSYNVGAVVNLGDFAVAGSYGSNGKSLNFKNHSLVKKSDFFYTVSGAYSTGPFKVSLLHFASNKFDNKLSSFTLGAEYQMAPGLKAYIEGVRFTLDGKPELVEAAKNKENKGYVGLLGFKLSL